MRPCFLVVVVVRPVDILDIQKTAYIPAYHQEDESSKQSAIDNCWKRRICQHNPGHVERADIQTSMEKNGQRNLQTKATVEETE